MGSQIERINFYELGKANTRIRELEDRLAALDWRPITPESLPSVDNHEIGKWHQNRFWQVNSSDWFREFADYQRLGWTHFRYLNAPQEPAKETK